MTDGVFYDVPQALQSYGDAHSTLLKIGALAQDINNVFQNEIPQVFVSGASASVQEHHRVINGKFEEVHAEFVKLMGDVAQNEVQDLADLDRRLAGG